MKNHGLRTPNEDLNQKNLKFWADVTDKILFGRTKNIWDWDLNFGRAVKAIFSTGVRSPCEKPRRREAKIRSKHLVFDVKYFS
jgi:hypothetical protein